MEQLTQKLGSGEMSIQELPIPQLTSGMVLVKNHYSLISAGTEGSTVKAARKSLIGKAKERPQQVKQVLEVFRKQGIVQTYRAVMKKLDAYSPLGYSCAGEVIAVAGDVTEFKVGDKVACAGAGYANHAEVVNVPVNLCVKLNADADLSLACYNTLGAIALQGVRQADMRLGETCAVIGLGLIGQLVCLELQASGVNVVGIDISGSAVETAREHCTDLALPHNTPNIEEQINDYTNGLGVDCVIIAAATQSIDPINFAGAICKKKGRVVVLGAVPTGFDRDPYYYKKELDVRMSCSYGPGRYDLNYEEKGLDYPAAYVRWTEKRNMEAFQTLVHTGKIDLAYLTTHRFKFEEAPKAYDIVVKHTEPFLGIVLEYDYKKEHKRTSISILNAMPVQKINIGFIGAGSYAQGSLLPNLPSVNQAGRISVMTNSGTTSKRVAEKFHFANCTSNEMDILGNRDINTLFIATRHDTHAHYVIEGLKAGKNVYVEKPLCLTLEELIEIEGLCKEKNCGVMIGFNRRFSPFARLLKKELGSGKMSMLYRINAGYIPADTWGQDMKIGGGRIIGEVCHFIDLMTFMCGSLPRKVSASALPDAQGLNDTVNIIIDFENGSTGVVAYYANGSKALAKEYFEVYSAGTTGIIYDFKKCEIYGKRVRKETLSSQDKGQKEMLDSFFQSLKEGNLPINMSEIFSVTKATFAALKSIQESGAPILF
ncbi:MAG: bi-domain-containing oxidoreductase [Bacteroides sp.]|nr:bi-domain-containing oxidoreductase [Bacteroides sp.]